MNKIDLKWISNFSPIEFKNKGPLWKNKPSKDFSFNSYKRIKLFYLKKTFLKITNNLSTISEIDDYNIYKNK